MSQRSTHTPCTNTISLLFSSLAISAVKLERKWSDWINYTRVTTQESRIVCNSTVVDTTQECVQTEFKYFPTFLTGLYPNPCNFQHRTWFNHYVVYSSLRLLYEASRGGTGSQKTVELMLISRVDQGLCGLAPSCSSQTCQLGVSSQSHDPTLFSTQQASESPATLGAPAFISIPSKLISENVFLVTWRPPRLES